jgi:hypothetical protein
MSTVDRSKGRAAKDYRWGNPPVGPGRLRASGSFAYGHARVQFLFEDHASAWGSVDGGQPSHRTLFALPVCTSACCLEKSGLT